MRIGVWLVGAALLSGVSATAGAAEPSQADALKAYEAERAKVGRDADAHVRLALWCEANGLQAERLRHLALAVLHDPTHPMARGLMGLVAYRGRWQRPEAVTEAARADPARAAAVAEYLDRRAKADDTADAQGKLALWCEQNGLKEQSVAHWRAVVRLDPSREAAWKRLGYRKQGGRWVSDAQLAAQKEDANLQRRADRQWRGVLERHREALEGKNANRREAAEAALAAVSDPRAVPSVWAVFAAKPDAARQTVAVQLLGQIDAASASRSLALLAVSGRTAEVRRAAAETLTRRDVREFADLLIAFVREPIKYEVKEAGGPGTSGELSVSGAKTDVKRLYTPPPVPLPTILPTDRVTFDAQGLPVILRPFAARDEIIAATPGSTEGFSGVASSLMSQITPSSEFSARFPGFVARHAGAQAGLAAQNAVRNAATAVPPGLVPAITSSGPMLLPAGSPPMWRYFRDATGVLQIPLGRMAIEAQNAKDAANRRMEQDVESIESYNDGVRRSNDRVLPVLALVSGRPFGPDRAAWNTWWVDQVGMAVLPQKSQEKTTVIEQVPIDYQPRPISPTVVAQDVFIRRSTSCFAAGTPVKTIDGPRPIESLEPGDLVLTQNTTTGALGYHAVLKVHRNPPSTTFRVSAGGDAVVSSAFHRFWVAGRGWVMARELKAGDTLRTLGGLAKVDAISDERVQPVFNLDVAEDADFFVGRAGALVHDNSLPDLRVTPFDAPAVADAGRKE